MPADDISQELQAILAGYTRARTSQQFAGSELRSRFSATEARLKEHIEKADMSHLHVRFSIGQGNWARIPWIAITDDRETTTIQDGIYCVFLFCEDMSGFYLALQFGVTETISQLGRRTGREELRQRDKELRPELTAISPAASIFNMDDEIDLRTGSNLGKDYEYSTIAYKFYRSGAIPSDTSLLSDIDSLLETYEGIVATDPRPERKQPRGGAEISSIGPELVESFVRAAETPGVGLRLTHSQVLRLCTSLLAKRFLILTGLAGSGKTKAAQALAHWLSSLNEGSNSETPTGYALVPVGADWTSNENILGYPDGLDSERYVSKPVLELVLEAMRPENQLRPYFLILDEMNLSHVERYFSDFLSAMESSDLVPLYEGANRNAGNLSVPNRVRLPENLFVIGTVNVDETTYMFSPKVLDRANVIEFRMNSNDLSEYLSSPTATDITKLVGQGARFAESFVSAATQKDVEVPPAARGDFQREMLLFFTLLRQHDLEYGYRTAYEASRFIYYYKLLGGYSDNDQGWLEQAMDALIVQKFLPKLHGSRSRLEGALWALAWSCSQPRSKPLAELIAEITEAGAAQDDTKYGPDVVEAELKRRNQSEPWLSATYPISFEKVMRMWRKLVQDQFVSFAEA